MTGLPFLNLFFRNRSKSSSKNFSTLDDILPQRDSLHIFEDIERSIIVIDRDRQMDPTIQNFLADHQALRGAVFKVEWVPFSDIPKRKDELRLRQAKLKSPGTVDNTAQARAIAILKDAALCRASDVHILRRANHTEVQFRIKKNLLIYREVSCDEGDSLLNALCYACTSGDNTIKPYETQDGGLNGNQPELVGTGIENVRMVRGPMYRGQHMELRVQGREQSEGSGSLPPSITLRECYRPEGELKLRAYGFTEDQVERLLSVLRMPKGIIMLTGPVGSGKTTTNYELLKQVARINPGKRLITIAQPVEYEMPWAIQLEISNTLSAAEAGKKAQEYLRYSLRMDPNVLEIAEIRDAEIAITAISAAQTGRQVFTTMHIDCAFEYASRLENFDGKILAPRITCNSSVFKCIVAQRLIPLLCPQCKEPWDYDEAAERENEREGKPKRAARAIASWGDMSLVYTKKRGGCSHCQYTGFKSVTAVAEVVEPDEELMSDLATYGADIARRRFRSRPEADTSMVEKAIDRVFEGIIDPWSILDEIDRIPTKQEIERDRRTGAYERSAAGKRMDGALASGEEP